MELLILEKYLTCCVPTVNCKFILAEKGLCSLKLSSCEVSVEPCCRGPQCGDPRFLPKCHCIALLREFSATAVPY